MSKPEPYKWSKCPLPNCGEMLFLELTNVIYVEDRPMVDFKSDNAEYFEVTCANGHTLDSGGYEADGRNALHGYRAAQALGGLR